MFETCEDLYGNFHTVATEDLVDRHSAYGVYLTNGSVLLIQDPRSKRWELPGGGLEPDEEANEALQREFTEETGLEVVGDTDFITNWTEFFFEHGIQEGWRSHRAFYLVHTVTGDLVTTGNDDDVMTAGLIPITELNRFPIRQNILNVIKRAIELQS